MLSAPTLFVFSGLPGAGKSTIARALAEETGALWLRIDSIESGLMDADIGVTDMKGAGYWAAQNVAMDNLLLKHSVIADCVNPFSATRDSWAEVAGDLGCRLCEIEVHCSNKVVHRERVEARHQSNDWAAVEVRRFDPWDRQVLRVDSYLLSVPQAVAKILASEKV